MSVLQDVRQAARTLRQRPLFAAVACVSIAVGVGGTTTVFSIVNALLLRPAVGIVEPERVVEIGRTNRGGGFDTFSIPELRDIQALGAFSHVAGVRMVPVSHETPAGGERMAALTVSQPYFGAMGLQPALGRFFLPEEDAVPGSGAVAVVSHRFWQERLGGSAEVLGSTIAINRTAFTVVGVTPADFGGHIPAMAPDVYLPLSMLGVAQPGFGGFDARGGSSIQMVGRLANGMTLEQANAGLATLFGGLRASFPELYVDSERSARAIEIGPVPGGGRTMVAAFLGLLGGLTGLVLVITCANVAGMLLARSVTREREVSIRLALGAGRGRIVAQLLTESLVLFVIGGLGGVLVARWATGMLSSIDLPSPVPMTLDLRPDGLVLAYGLGVALAAGLLFGLAPALHAARGELAGAMRTHGGMARGGRMRRLFVTAQVGFSVVLLAASGLFLRSLQQAAHVPTGFDESDTYVVGFNLAMDGYDDAEGAAFVAQMLERMRAAPGVEAAGVVTDLPLDMSLRENTTIPEGWPMDDERPGFSTAFNSASDGYLEAIHATLLRGRTLQPTDDADGTRAVIVSRAYVERAWADGEALGRTIRIDGDDGPPYTVVGVIDDIKDQSLMETARPAVWLPVAQRYRPELSLVVRMQPGVAGAAVVRAALRELDPGIALSPVQRLEDFTAMGTMPQRIAASITSVLGLLALLLSALGVYGVVAFMVAQRTREIGLRIAIGARASDVTRLVVGSTLRLVAPGIVLGGCGAVALAFVVRGYLLGVAPLDAFTFGGVLLAVTLLVVAASAAPARRAVRVEPLTALRAE